MKIIELCDGVLRYWVAGNTVACKSYPDRHRFKEFNIHDPDENMPPCHKCGGKLERMRYLVDMGEYFGNGSCGCENFHYRLRPQLEEMIKGLMPNRPAPAHIRRKIVESPLRCSHIMICRRYFLDEVIAALSDKERKEKYESDLTQRAVGMALPSRQ